MMDSGAAILRHRTSDVNLLHHWRMHVQTSYICLMIFDVSSTSRFPYVIVTVFRKVSTKLCVFLQCTSDVNVEILAYVTGSVSQDGSILDQR